MDCVAADNTWGPWAGPECRGGLDFTLLFEESILILLPAVLLIIAAVLQVAWLFGRPRQTANGILMPVKQVRCLLAAAVSLGFLGERVLTLSSHFAGLDHRHGTAQTRRSDAMGASGHHGAQDEADFGGGRAELCRCVPAGSPQLL